MLATEASNAQVLGTEVGAVPAGQSFAIAATNGQVANGCPDIASDGTSFIVVSANTGTSEYGTDVYATRVGTDGTVLDTTPIHLINDPNGISDPSVVWDGTDYVVVWVGGTSASATSGAGEIFAARVAPDGTVLDTTPVQVTTGSNAKFRPVGLAFDSADQNFLVAWRALGDSLLAARFSTSLADLDSASGFLVAASGTNLSRFYPWVAYGGGVYLVVWHQGYGGSGGGGCTQAQGCAGSLAVAGARVTPTGQVLDPGGFAISSDPNDLQDFASAAFDGTNFLVTWHNWANSDAYNNGSGSAARVTPAGVVLDQPAITINSREMWEPRPDVVFDGTNYLVVWHVNNVFEKSRDADAYGTRVSPSGQVLDEKPSPIDTELGNQWEPSVGYASGNFLVAWNEDNSTSPRCQYDHCVFGEIMQDSSNAGTARSPVTPAPSASGWKISATPTAMWLQTVYGLDNTHVYATGQSSGSTVPFLEFNGTSWSSVASPGRGHLYGLWGASPTSLWATGFCWEFLQFDASASSFTDDGCTSGTPTSLSLWGSDPDSIFAVGSGYAPGTANPVYSHYDGQQWNSTGDIGVSLDLSSIWGVDADSAYAVGENGTILHYDGTSWNPAPGVPTIERLNGVWGISDSDIFAVGDFGTILHFDGTSWTTQSSGVDDDLTSVWGFNGSDVYAAGFNGRILHYDGTSWTVQASPTTENLTAVTGAGNDVWAVGDAGTILQLVTAGNPTPELISLSPDSAPPGADVTVQVTGANFVRGSTVRWDGSEISTTFVSSTELTAIIPSTSLDSPFPDTSLFPNGFGEITVSSPPPQGGISVGLPFGIATGPAASLSVTSLTFSSQTVGTTSSAQPVVLTNLGNTSLNITGITISANFTETNDCGSTLSPSSNCTINVSFAPTAASSLTGTLSIADNAAGSPQTVSLSGTGSSPGVKISATSLTFPSQALGSTSAAQTVTVTNTGSGNLTFGAGAVTVTGTNAPDFAVSSDTCSTQSISSNGTCSVEVTFKPSVIGTESATLDFADNAAGSPQTVGLSGTGKAPFASLSPTSLDFGNQLVGTTSAAQQVTLTNSGNATLSISAIAATGEFAQTNNCGTSLAAGTNCSVSVTFTPTASGTRTGSLTVTDNAASSPQSVTLKGTATAPIVGLTPTSLKFSSQLVGTTSAAQQVKLTNSGSAVLSISSIAMTGEFAEANNCGSSVAAGASCAINITFKPAAAGAHTSALNISDNASGSPQKVALSGTGEDFTLAVASGGSSTDTVAAGSTASYSLSVAPVGGFNQTVSISCAGAPSLATCTASPASVTPNGTNPVAVNIKVSTTAATAVPPSPAPASPLGGEKLIWPALGLVLLAILAMLGAPQPRRRAWLTLALTLALIGMSAACGGGGPSPTTGAGGGNHTAGTPAGTYSLTVSGTDGTLAHSAILTLTVQ